MDPNNRVSGHKYHEFIGFWALKPYDFGPWTLTVLISGESDSYGNVGGTGTPSNLPTCWRPVGEQGI